MLSRRLIRKFCLAAPLLALGFAAEIASAQLYEADTGSGKILEFTSSGVESTFASGLNQPAGLAFDPSGNLFVSASGTGRIVKFTPGGIKSTFATGLDQPTGLAFDASGNLFVAASGSGRIVKITHGALKSTFASGLNHPSCLAFDAFGNLFACTSTGVAAGGRIVKFSPGGAKTTFASGLLSPSGLAFDAQGNLYVADKGNAQIYKFTAAKTKSIFASGSTFGVAFDTQGNLFRSDGAGGILESAADGAVSTFATGLSQSGSLAFPPFAVLHSFSGPDGAYLLAGLFQATNGDLYGATEAGGVNKSPGTPDGYGTIFKITTNSTLTTLYSLCSQNGCTDGAFPGSLVQAKNGDLYGTTNGGGTNGNGYGTIFKISPSGTLATLYSFCAQSGCTDGALPSAGLVQGAGGDLYGTTSTGGANRNSQVPRGAGTIFKITPDGTLTTLYSFCSQRGCTDGAIPFAGLVQATNGDLYGTTASGGANCATAGTPGCGTVFKITPSGTLTTLYSFCAQDGCMDGDNAQGQLVQAANGDLLGTTYLGGAGTNCFTAQGCGTIFRITPSGTLTTLHSFCSQPGCADGAFPTAALVQAANGELYGTATSGGAGAGTIFKITSDGVLTSLFVFCSDAGCTDGADPVGALVQDTNGKFYGTTRDAGGNGNHGTVFSLPMGLNAFVKTRSTSGQIGESVKILGTNLTGATSVTFNGIAATFTVDSSSEISATVPTGATTGKIEVVVPAGTLESNLPFTVSP